MNKNQKIDFTIIIPHYNCAMQLKRLLNSIGKHDNMQIIVVDDNSDTDTIILENLKKEFLSVEFYKNPTDKKSAGICRNIGIDHANGRWIIFADADDYFTEHYYENISSYVNSDADMIIFKNIEISQKTGREIEVNTKNRNIDSYIKTRDLGLELKIRYKMSTIWSRMIMTKKIRENNVRCDETIVANDVGFAMKVGYYCKKMLVVDKVIYCYVRASDTLTTTISAERNDIRVQVFINCYHFLENHLSPAELKVLQLNASGLLLNAMLDGLGTKYVLGLWVKMKRNKIKILDESIWNIPLIAKKLWSVTSDHAKRKEVYWGNDE